MVIDRHEVGRVLLSKLARVIDSFYRLLRQLALFLHQQQVLQLFIIILSIITLFVFFSWAKMYGVRIWKDDGRLAYGILIYFVLLHAHLNGGHAAVIVISHIHGGGVALRKLINLIGADASLTKVALSSFGHGLQREHLVRRADVVDADSLYFGV